MDRVARVMECIAKLPVQPRQAQAVVEVAEDARRDAAQGDGQDRSRRAAGEEQPVADDHGGDHGKGGKNCTIALAHAEQRPFVEAGLETEDLGPPPADAGPGTGIPSQPNTQRLRRQVHGAAAAGEARRR